jgi:hypothetical protein
MSEFIANLRHVPGHHGYKVTCDGRVFSFISNRDRHLHELSPAVADRGHLFVWLAYDDRPVFNRGKYRRPGRKRYIHQVALEAFVGPRPSPSHDACHRDGNPKNNHVDNLYWGTKTENREDARRHGTMRLGQDAGATLSQDQAAEIKTRLSNGENVLPLSQEFNVEPHVVQSIKSAKSWGWLLPELNGKMTVRVASRTRVLAGVTSLV